MGVIPYVHKLAHNLKHVGNRYSVDVKFSAKSKLASVCPRVNKPIGSKACSVKHRNMFVKCVKGVVYMTPFSCGKVYIGQSGRCVNDRLREHHASVKASGNSHLADHCRNCGCYPVFKETEIIFRHKDQLTREIVESYHIRKRGHDCVSQATIVLHDKEYAYLDT